MPDPARQPVLPGRNLQYTIGIPIPGEVMMSTTLSSKGQVVIPQQYREALGLTPGSRVDFEINGNVLELRLARKPTKLEDGFGMLHHTGKPVPPDFDPASLLRHDRG